MGTRSVTIVIHKGEIKVAQYGQSDGYPESMGVSALSFLRDPEKVNQLKQVLPKVRFYSRSDSWENMDLSRNSETYLPGDWENNLEDRANVLRRIPKPNDPIFISVLEENEYIFEVILKYKDRPAIILTDAYGFAAESLWCEWAYVIDFDKHTFEVYHGFNTTGINRGDRFYHLHKEISDYYPVKILTSFSLDELPGNDGFINVCRKLFKEK